MPIGSWHGMRGQPHSYCILADLFGDLKTRKKSGNTEAGAVFPLEKR